MNFRREISYFLGIMTYLFLRSLPPSPVFFFSGYWRNQNGGSLLSMLSGASIWAQALVVIICGHSLRYIKAFLLCFGTFRASKPGLSNFEGKRGKSLSLRNKIFPYGNSYSLWSVSH